MDDIVAQIDQQKGDLNDLVPSSTSPNTIWSRPWSMPRVTVMSYNWHCARAWCRPFMFRLAMTFIHEDANAYVGWFWQNSMQRLAAGDEAEVVLDGIPGQDLPGQR